MILVNPPGNVALQQRTEPDSKGKWDVSASGHQDIGETDLLAAVREAEEELAIKLSPARLLRLGEPYRFRKAGSPLVEGDIHDDPVSFRYQSKRLNCERMSVFLA